MAGYNKACRSSAQNRPRDDNMWQLNLSLTERNEVMLNHELATDVTFQVSASTEG